MYTIDFVVDYCHLSILSEFPYFLRTQIYDGSSDVFEGFISFELWPQNWQIWQGFKCNISINIGLNLYFRHIDLVVDVRKEWLYLFD